jgi:hypothetical protein
MYRNNIVLFFSLLVSQINNGQVTLEADGPGILPGNTYELITSALAPGYNPIEVPDCNHSGFGRHIDEYFDTDLGKNVFRFYIHTNEDDDRCINFDRQRNEIKTYDQSPDNLLGIENEIVVYKWKFKLDSDFQVSPNFTHLHQLKSVGGSLASMPMYTITARKSTPDRLELRYAETTSQVTLAQTDLAPFKGIWLEVIETITYGNSGTYSITISKVSDNSVLLSYSDNDIINWRAGASFVRPKWGIYRSLNNDQDLRDETVMFADFSIEEVSSLSINKSKMDNNTIKIFPNPSKNKVTFKTDNPKNYDYFLVYNTLGQKLTQKNTKKTFNTSTLKTGTYHIVFYKNDVKLETHKLVIK